MKIFTGIVKSIKMNNTVVVEITRRTPHPLYKKLLKRSSRFNVAAPDHTVAVGERVKIIETRPLSKNVHFKLMEAKKDEGKK